MSFLYLFYSAIMDSPGGEFNSYKSKAFRTDVKYFELVRISYCWHMHAEV